MTIENGAIRAQVHPHSRVCLAFLSLFCITPGLGVGGGGAEHCVYSNPRSVGLPSKSSPDTEGIAWPEAGEGGSRGACASVSSPVN